MRRLGFLIPCLAVSLTACNEEVLTDVPAADSSKSGKISFSLEADLRNETVTVRSSSSEEISTDEFWVEIFNSSDTRIFCELYEDAKDTVLNVNSGDYRFRATYGNETGVGFDAPYYKAEENFTVGGQQTVNVSATAKLANVKVKVVFSENLDDKLSYDTYYALVRNNGKKLRFNPGETRSGYIPAGNLEFVLYVQVNGVWKQYILPAAEYQPNDFVTFNVEVGRGEGDIVLKIFKDDTVEVVEETVEIPSEEVMPVAEPVIYSQGFDNDNTITYIEGKAEALNEVWLSSYAEGQFASAVLALDSEALSALGLPASTDLVTADEATVAAFEAAGIWWRFSDDNTNLTISLADAYNDVISKAEYVGYDEASAKCLPVAEISLAVTGAKGAANHAEDSFRIIATPDAVAAITWNDYDVWATRIVNPVENVSKGKPALFTLQGSADGMDWVEVGTPSISGNTISFGTVDGLGAGTTYYMRALYDGWYIASDRYEFTTEESLQVANAGFEEWTTYTHYFTYNFIGSWDHNIDWYCPDSGWAVNSKKSMPSSTSVASANWNWVRFPTAAYTSDAYKGSKAAMIYSVSVGDGSSSVAQGRTNVVGEMWTGTADGSGNHASNIGLSLASRPTSLKFAYKYKSVDGEKFVLSAEVRDADGNVIASLSTNSGTASDSWTSMSLDFSYSVYDKKADNIYIVFKCSGNSSPAIDLDSSVTIAENNTCDGNFGSVLYIDELELVY